jgi:hypothetical protein
MSAAAADEMLVLPVLLLTGVHSRLRPLYPWQGLRSQQWWRRDSKHEWQALRRAAPSTVGSSELCSSTAYVAWQQLPRQVAGGCLAALTTQGR